MPLITRNSQNANVKLGTTAQLSALTFVDGDLASDTTLNKLKIYDGSTLQNVGATSFSSSAVVSQSTTIGDFTTPTSAVSSSNGTLPSTITFSDTFTTSANWTQTGSTITVNTGSTRIDYDGQINGVNGSRLYHDMGIGVISDTKWVLRFPWNVTTATTNSGNNQPYGFFGISDEITTGVSEPNDCIGIRWGSEPLLYQINSRNNGSATNTSFSRAPQVEQIYIEMIRTSTTNVTINFYSDSGYSTLLETKSQTISSSIINLRYIVFSEYDASGYVSGGGRLIARVNSTLEFYNNVDSVNEAQLPALLIDNNTATKWFSSSESNPNCYVDMGSALNLCAAAFYFDSTNTTNTEILIQSSADASTWTTRRTITESNLTNGAYNYYRFNIAGGARYIRFYGNSSGSTVLSIWEIKILKKTDAEIFNDLGILTITASDTALGPDGT